MKALLLGIALAVPAAAADSRLEAGRQALNDGLPQVAIYKLRQAIGRKLPKEGQNAAEFTALRLLVGYFVSVIVALAVHNLPQHLVVRQRILSQVSSGKEVGASRDFRGRVARALEVAAADFLDVMVFFILGVAISALFSTAVNQELIIPFALNDWVATFSLMGFAALLSLCSTSDAFIAATLIAFPGVAKLAFLVFGPMFDLKLLFIYSAVFRKRFIAGLAAGLFVLIGLICVRLRVLGI